MTGDATRDIALDGCCRGCGGHRFDRGGVCRRGALANAPTARTAWDNASAHRQGSRGATPWENARRCEGILRFPLAGKAAFRRLADLVVMALYAGVEPSEKDCELAQEALRTFRQQARNYARWFARSQWSWQSVKEWLSRW